MYAGRTYCIFHDKCLIPDKFILALKPDIGTKFWMGFKSALRHNNEVHIAARLCRFGVEASRKARCQSFYSLGLDQAFVCGGPLCRCLCVAVVPFGSPEALLVMRRDLSRLSTSLKLFIRHPYSRSSKASNPRLPRWRTDSEADRRVGCKSVQEMLNTLSMTEHFTFTTFSAMLSAWGCETKGSTCKRKTRHVRYCANVWVQTCRKDIFRISPCSDCGLRLFRAASKVNFTSSPQ